MTISDADKFLTIRDNLVSHESFDLYRDAKFDMLVTNPKPTSDNLSKYYESENYISHTDSRKSLVGKLYQIVKRISLKRKLMLLNSFQDQKGCLLDIGAGTGDFLAVAKKDGWKAIGTEPNGNARHHAEQKGLQILKDTAIIPKNSIDVISMWHVLEHVEDTKTQITELRRLLKADGTVVIAVPNFKSFDAGYYREFWAAYDVPRHLWHFSKTSIRMLFEEQDMTITKILPMKFDSFYVSLLSEKYKTGRNNYIKALLIGAKSNYIASTTNEYSSHIYIIKRKT